MSNDMKVDVHIDIDDSKGNLNYTCDKNHRKINWRGGFFSSCPMCILISKYDEENIRKAIYDSIYEYLPDYGSSQLFKNKNIGSLANMIIKKIERRLP